VNVFYQKNIGEKKAKLPKIEIKHAGQENRHFSSEKWSKWPFFVKITPVTACLLVHNPIEKDNIAALTAFGV
jgi:hypothetical protein